MRVQGMRRLLVSGYGSGFKLLGLIFYRFLFCLVTRGIGSKFAFQFLVSSEGLSHLSQILFGAFCLIEGPLIGSIRFFEYSFILEIQCFILCMTTLIAYDGANGGKDGRKNRDPLCKAC